MLSLFISEQGKQYFCPLCLQNILTLQMSSKLKVEQSTIIVIFLPSKEFELTANLLGAHMKVTESSPSTGHIELILRTFI